MKVFIAIKVPRENQDGERLVDSLSEMLITHGHIPFVAYRQIARQGLTPLQFMPYVRQEISYSDLVVVIYSPDLRGGLIELGIAYSLEKPIWLAIHQGEYVSSSAQASASQLIYYRTTKELVAKLVVLLAGEAIE